MTVELLNFEVPIAPHREGNRSFRIDIHLTPEERDTLHHIVSALDLNGETIKDGRRVTNAPTAVKWLLQAIGRDIRYHYNRKSEQSE